MLILETIVLFKIASACFYQHALLELISSGVSVAHISQVRGSAILLLSSTVGYYKVQAQCGLQWHNVHTKCN
jgi:hypothetical protein